MTVSNKPGHRGEREVSRKTIARGMPGRSGVTVVTMLVCFILFRTRGCGRIARPAFPAPSVLRRDNHSQNLGRIQPRGCGRIPYRLFEKIESETASERGLRRLARASP